MDWRTRVRGRRWRPRPLRRRCDVVEAWTALVVTVLLVVGAPPAGVVAGSWALATARSEAAEQRAGLHRVSAVVVADAPAPVPSANGGKQPTCSVKARWADPSEGVRTGTGPGTGGHPARGARRRLAGRPGPRR